MTTPADMPAWLTAWREANPEAAAKGDAAGAVAQAAADQRAAMRAASAPQPRSPRVQCVTSKHPKLAPLPDPVSKWGQGFAEPAPWDFDQCKRREVVLDHSFTPPRVVRSVGWRVCMKCATPFFSGDVVGVRLCDGCKNPPAPR